MTDITATHSGETAANPAATPDSEKGTPIVQQPEIFYNPPSTANLATGYFPAPTRKFANPVPAGMSVMATTLFTLGLILCRAHSVDNLIILGSTFYFSAGLIQIIAGIWCIVVENTFAAALLLSLGGFWAGIGGIATNDFGAQSAYDSDTFASAFGLFLSAWTVFDFLLWTCTFRSTIPLFCTTFCLWFFMLLWTISIFGTHPNVETAAGVFAFLTSCGGYYAVYEGLTSEENSYARIPKSKRFLMPYAYNAEKAEKSLV
ncbi:unnamed protein product [Kuraishia capsulata CBS 1993]|uniref:Uncharacterized protein n=1 Tax=Kuraishia capsulata CBS 1993 TaxID=1382522 RepID=W6MNS7_9ASCO|nr:uncharacterized protein KUCA_T00004306001 [Kuraishia capsulata CBS 1993]CDK28324.1 unnamed protein product [Kuraishia capsulata CBS 1993]